MTQIFLHLLHFTCVVPMLLEVKCEFSGQTFVYEIWHFYSRPPRCFADVSHYLQRGYKRCKKTRLRNILRERLDHSDNTNPLERLLLYYALIVFKSIKHTTTTKIWISDVLIWHHPMNIPHYKFRLVTALSVINQKSFKLFKQYIIYM